MMEAIDIFRNKRGFLKSGKQKIKGSVMFQAKSHKKYSHPHLFIQSHVINFCSA